MRSDNKGSPRLQCFRVGKKQNKTKQNNQTNKQKKPQNILKGTQAWKGRTTPSGVFLTEPILRA